MVGGVSIINVRVSAGRNAIVLDVTSRVRKNYLADTFVSDCVGSRVLHFVGSVIRLN